MFSNIQKVIKGTKEGTEYHVYLSVESPITV